MPNDDGLEEAGVADRAEETAGIADEVELQGNYTCVAVLREILYKGGQVEIGFKPRRNDGGESDAEGVERFGRCGGGKSGLGDERNAPVMFLHGHSAESGAETTLRQKEAEGLGTNPSCAHGAAHAEHFPMGSMIEFKVNFCRRGEDKGGRPSTHAVECGQGPLGRQG